jgi:myo-inositol catabolism protein IolC
MAPGYRTPLYLLAFDHRSSFEKGLFRATAPVSDDVRQRIVEVKHIIFDANQLAIDGGAPREQCGILVDEEFGSTVAREAEARSIPLAMPVEKSGQAEFQFQYGEHFAEHIEAFDPTFSKVLVRYNPEGDADLNHRQTDRLARLSEWLGTRNRKFLFELLVPATAAQLDQFEDNTDDYDRGLRPELAVATIAALQAGGVEPDIWKVEGLDRAADAQAIVRQARTGGRDRVDCIILGRGADWDRVAHWVQVAAAVDGFKGFAVGRTLWQEPLVNYVDGRTSSDQAASAISDRYRQLIDIYNEADVPSRIT